MIVLLVFIVGLIFGSFINALVWRLHAKKDWVRERSICPHCKHVLAAKDLVPILSWLSLRGKCRYCKKPISIQYPAVELLTASVFALSYSYWPASFNLAGIFAFIPWLVSGVLLIALLVYDIRWMLLPNKLVVALSVSSTLVVLFLAISANRPVDLVMALLGGAVLAGIFWTLFTVSKGKWIGGGDVKIAFALGLLAGNPAKALLVLFFASVLGTVMALPLLASKKLKASAKIPFGPFLIVATIIVFLFGSSLIAWYNRTFLYL